MRNWLKYRIAAGAMALAHCESTKQRVHKAESPQNNAQRVHKAIFIDSCELSVFVSSENNGVRFDLPINWRTLSYL